MALSDNVKLNPDAEQTFGGTAINAVVDWTYNENATQTDINSDGNPVNQGSIIDNIGATVTITTQAASQSFGTFKVGDCGGLVLTGVTRSCGSGADQAITITMSNANLTDISNTVPHEGVSNTTMTFRVFDNGDSALYTTS